MPTKITDLPAPVQFGLPSHYTSWRPVQWQAVERVVDSRYRFTAQSMPTGSGKSLVYMAAAAIHGGRTAILTSTKALQAQLMRDFEAMGLVEIRGQNSYPCKAVMPGEEHEQLAPDPVARRKARMPEVVGCDEGPCHFGMKCTLKAGGCGYFDAVKVAGLSELVVANYSYWLTIHRWGQGMGGFDLLILDESHDAPDKVSEFLAVELEEAEVQLLLHTRLMPEGTRVDQWRDWAAFHRGKLEEKLAVMGQQLMWMTSNGEVPSKDVMVEAKRTRGLLQRLTMLAGIKEDWVEERDRGRRGGVKVKLSPVWPGPYTEEALFREIGKVVLVSATIRPKTMEYLGIPVGEREFVEYPSTFDLKRQPIYFLPTVSMKYGVSEGELKIWLAKMDQIIRARPGKKGIIHTKSYDRARIILQNSEWGEGRGYGGERRLLGHGPDETRQVVERFKTSTEPLVLVSPAVTTGYDFPYEQCEFQIVAKVPFPDGKNALTRARTAQDEEYPMHLAMTELVQMCGRGMRAGDDRCETFIIDSNIKWFWYKYRQMAPGWFRNSVKWIDVIPQRGPEKVSRPT